MKMRESDSLSLRKFLANTRDLGERYLGGIEANVRLEDLMAGSTLESPLALVSGRSVLLKTRDHFAAALALVQLDGVARRIVLCPSDVPPDHLAPLIADAEADTLVTDSKDADTLKPLAALRIACLPRVGPAAPPPRRQFRTEWLLLTSGTTGRPKMAVHSLASLTDAIKTRRVCNSSVVWGTFYDIRRYGGLQIYLRALLGGASLVLPGACEPVAAFVVRLKHHGVTHLSGTPSHWRRVLMLPANELSDLRYVRLSGEIADQTLLDGLKRAYPLAKIGHAYASTEAGVVFHVDDGLEGWPAALLNSSVDNVNIKVVDGTLRVRSRRTASGYAGSRVELLDADGFVDTGDVVELRNGRYHFIGRRGGIVNVGGMKVHPEEVESVINRHPGVRMSLVRARKNPFTGAVVIADVLLNDQAEADERGHEVEQEILQLCRDTLPEHKVPALIRFVPNLEVAATGKLVRSHA
jgi:acyl-coenzyme A synthetase/AMP-(fatty) acid ligase